MKIGLNKSLRMYKKEHSSLKAALDHIDKIHRRPGGTAFYYIERKKYIVQYHFVGKDIMTGKLRAPKNKNK